MYWTITILTLFFVIGASAKDVHIDDRTGGQATFSVKLAEDENTCHGDKWEITQISKPKIPNDEIACLWRVESSRAIFVDLYNDGDCDRKPQKGWGRATVKPGDYARSENLERDDHNYDYNDSGELTGKVTCIIIRLAN